MGRHALLCTEPVFGGFHRPGQGYRHLQAAAVITVYGDLSENTRWTPELAALDLLRSYAHDCLHYGSYRGSYRRYSLPEAGGGVDRVRYGINFRQSDGRTYSARDGAGVTTTRNLGVMMEGQPIGRLPAIPTVYALHQPDNGVIAWVLALPGGQACIVSAGEQSTGVVHTSLGKVPAVSRWVGDCRCSPAACDHGSRAGAWR